jgi:hypothetical protein
VKVSLLEARGLKAREQGKDEEAKKLCREALDLYKGMQENFATLNNSALVYFDLYDLEYDPELFKEGVLRMEKALKGQPNSEVVVRNVASSLMGVVGADTVGDRVDYKKLRTRPSAGYLTYLYSDEAGQTKALAKVRAHEATARVRGHLGRLMMLAPRRPDVYSQLVRLHEQLGETKELQLLLERLGRTELDTADSIKESREYYEGKKDAKNRVELKASIKRARKALDASRKAKGPTHAAAACRLASLLMQLNIYEAVGHDEVVSLSEEAHKAAPSEATANMLAGALIFRAQQRLKKDAPAFAAVCKKAERSLGTYVVNWLIVRGGPLRAKLLADEDIKRAQQLRLEQWRKFPGGRGIADWSLLVASHPKEAADIARRIKARQLETATSEIDLKLAPLSGTATAVRAFVLQIEGKEEEARKLVASKITEGVPLPGAW